jgi:Protein of unknown function (DUF3467)
MPETTAPNPAQQPKVEPISPPEGIYSTYSNHAGVGAGPSDVRIFFGEIGNATPERVQVFQRVVVSMSWLQAKVLAHLLQDYVNVFEKLNGTIAPPKLPPVVLPSDPFGPK